jgi:signal peptidase I
MLFWMRSAGVPNERSVARIIGLPGDSVSIWHGAVYINGRRLAEPYVKNRAHYKLMVPHLPHNAYLVLGDNRNDSFDSSKWGLPWLFRADIIGEVVGLQGSNSADAFLEARGAPIRS